MIVAWAYCDFDCLEAITGPLTCLRVRQGPGEGRRGGVLEVENRGRGQVGKVGIYVWEMEVNVRRYMFPS